MKVPGLLKTIGAEGAPAAAMGVLRVLSEVGCATIDLTDDLASMLLMAPMVASIAVHGALLQFSALLKSCLKSDVLDDIGVTVEVKVKCERRPPAGRHIGDGAGGTLHRPLPPRQLPGSAFHGYAGVVDARRPPRGAPAEPGSDTCAPPGGSGQAAPRAPAGGPAAEGAPVGPAAAAAPAAAARGAAHQALETEELLGAFCRGLGRRGAVGLARASRAQAEGVRAALDALAAEEVPDIFVFGGHSQRERTVFQCGADFDLDTVHRFDASTSRWTVVSRMQTARSGCAVAVMGSAIYVVGGGTLRGNGVFPQPLRLATRFWPGSGRWEELPPLSSPRVGCAAAVAGGVLCVAGGLNTLTPLGSVEGFCAARGSWAPLPSMLRPRFGCAAASLASKVFAVGGGAPQRLSSVECMDLAARRPVWTPLPPMKTARYGCAAAATSDALLVVGGSCGAGMPLASVERFDTRSRSWEQLPPMSAPRVGCTAAVVGSTFIVLGGRSGERVGAVLADVERLELACGASWEQAPPMPAAFAGGAAAVAWWSR